MSTIKKAGKSMITAIVKRAKQIQAASGASWQAALKKAGAELRSTVKKVVKKAKPKKKATPKKRTAKKTTSKRKTTKRKTARKK